MNGPYGSHTAKCLRHKKIMCTKKVFPKILKWTPGKFGPPRAVPDLMMGTIIRAAKEEMILGDESQAVIILTVLSYTSFLASIQCQL